jgi:hypothetical protein
MNSKFKWQKQDWHSLLSTLPNLDLLKFAEIRFWDCGNSFLFSQVGTTTSLLLFVFGVLCLVLVVFLVFFVLNRNVKEHI